MTGSLIRRGSGNLNSLILDQICLFRSLGNSPKKPNVHRMVFTPVDGRNSAENAEFPVFTLLIRETPGGDRFASDCTIRQRVSG
jgi:hypothetical protein